MNPLSLIRRFFKIINGSNAPWQVFLGVVLGTLLGFMPVLPGFTYPAPLGLAVLGLAIVINCHFGSVLMFWAIGAALSLLFAPAALGVGRALDGLARAMADVPLLYHSWLSDHFYLGSTVLGLILAPIFGLVMAYLSELFRKKVRERLKAHKKMVRGTKLATNGLMIRFASWFLDIG